MQFLLIGTALFLGYPDVKAEWVAEQRSEAKRKAFDAMRARYEVVLPAAPRP